MEIVVNGNNSECLDFEILKWATESVSDWFYNLENLINWIRIRG